MKVRYPWVEFNTTEGEIGVYKRHVPTTVIISPGIVTITEAEGVKEAALHAGFAEILQDEVVIMAEIIEWPMKLTLIGRRRPGSVPKNG